MKYKLPQFNSIKEMAYIDVCRLTEDEARNILEHLTNLCWSMLKIKAWQNLKP
jgi:hypothetical protein